MARIETLERRRFLAGVAPVAGVNPIDIAVGGFYHDTLFYADGTVVASHNTGGLGDRTRIYSPSGAATADVPFSSTLRKVDDDEFETLTKTASSVTVTRYDLAGHVTVPTRTTPIVLPSTHDQFYATLRSDGTVVCVAVSSWNALPSTLMLMFEVDATGQVGPAVTMADSSRMTFSPTIFQLWAIDDASGGGVGMRVISGSTSNALIAGYAGDGSSRFTPRQVSTQQWPVVTEVDVEFARDGRFSVADGSSWQRYDAWGSPERSPIAIAYYGERRISYQSDGDAVLLTGMRFYYSDAQSSEVTSRLLEQAVANVDLRVESIGVDEIGWSVITSQRPYTGTTPPAVMNRRRLAEYETAGASLTGLAFRDDTDDGIRQSNETARFAGVFELYTQAGDWLGTSTVGANGFYSFVDVIPNWPVYVKQTGTTVRFPVAKDAGADDTADSDFDPVTRTTELVTLAPSELRTSVDLGGRSEHSFALRALYDVDGDGLPPVDPLTGSAYWSALDYIGESLFYIDQNQNGVFDAAEPTWRGPRPLYNGIMVDGGPPLYVPPGTYRIGIVPKRGTSFATPFKTITVATQPGASTVPNIAETFYGRPAGFATTAYNSPAKATRLLNVSSSSQLSVLDVDCGPAGDGVILYKSNADSGAYAGLRLRRFSADGTADASDVVLDAAKNPSSGGAIKLAADGSFWVAVDVGTSSPQFRRYSASGSPLTGWLSNAAAPLAARDLLPGLSVRQDGSYASVRKDSTGVWVSWFTAGGQLVCPETRVNTYANITIPGYAYDVADVEWLASGRTIVVFSRGYKSTASGVQEAAAYVRSFDAPGALADEETFLDGTPFSTTEFSPNGHVAYFNGIESIGRWLNPGSDRNANFMIGSTRGEGLPTGTVSLTRYDICDDGRIAVVQRVLAAGNYGLYLRIMQGGIASVATTIEQRPFGGTARWTFNQDVSSSLSVDDFELKNLTTGYVVPASELSVSTAPTSRSVVLTWPALDTGRWRLALKANSVVDAATGQTNALPLVWNGVVIEGTEGPDRVDVTPGLYLEARLDGRPSTQPADVRLPLQLVDFGLVDLRGGDDRVVTPPSQFNFRLSGGAGYDTLTHTLNAANLNANDLAIEDPSGSRFAHEGLEQIDVLALSSSVTPYVTSSGGLSPALRFLRVAQNVTNSLLVVRDGTTRLAADQAGVDPLLWAYAVGGRLEIAGSASLHRLEVLAPVGRPPGAAAASIAFLAGVQHVFVQAGVNGTTASGGFLDIGDAALISQVGTPEEFAGWVKAALAAPGNGGIGSTAATSPNQVVGVAPASAIAGTTFPKPYAGYSLQGAEIVSRLTLRGDANLDRVVDFDDLLKLAANYNATGRFWHQGDFNYDGTVNFDDLLLLAANYNRLLSGAARSGEASLVPPVSSSGAPEFAGGLPIGRTVGAAPPRLDSDGAALDEDGPPDVLA